MKRKYPNVIQCLECNYVLISRAQNEVNQCGCKNRVFVKGGYDYLHYIGKNLKKIQVLKLSKVRIS